MGSLGFLVVLGEVELLGQISAKWGEGKVFDLFTNKRNEGKKGGFT